MNLAPSDWAIVVMAIGGAATGVSVGFSGALAFLAGSGAAAFAARIGWPLSASFSQSNLARGAVVTIATILVFGIVRAVVRRSVKVAVAQPGDAIYGALTGVAAGVALGAGLVWLAQYVGIPGAENSVLFGGLFGHDAG